jgi:hypothetical protein
VDQPMHVLNYASKIAKGIAIIVAGTMFLFLLMVALHMAGV